TAAGIEYVTASRSTPPRWSARRMAAPSRRRLSPAPGAGPSGRAATPGTRSPSSDAMSPSRTVAPATVASRATVIRPVAPAAVAAARTSAAPRRLLDDRIGRPQHVVGALDRVRRHLVRALAGDERDQLLDDHHVGVVEEPLEQRAA